ncbi:MAG: radical SAM protein [Lentisphaeria bacterium]|nr:radical SAM protein [Lentisphaeria bacterium]
MPSIGRREGQTDYVRGWQMEPLGIGVLAALTPPDVSRVFYDDRLEAIPYEDATDLVCLSVETYTARRAYQISAAYRCRGARVVLGGFHPTLVPDEAGRHADAIVVGEVEGVWLELLADARAGHLRKRYQAVERPRLLGIRPDRTVFAGKNYVGLSLVETSRGCRFGCEFCSISSFFHRSYTTRPVGEVVAEVAALPKKPVFFVDDNIGADRERAKALFQALIPLKIRWAGQVSMDVADDGELLDLMRKSGCLMVLMGFESLNPEVLKIMGKSVNRGGELNDQRLQRLRRFGISVYGTFVFGYDGDTRESFEATLAFTRRHKMFFAAFNHLVPFPGTPLYARLAAENRLLYERWWLDESYRFGQVAFQPDPLTPGELADMCFEYRRKFYAIGSMVQRGWDWRANCRDIFRAGIFWYGNISSRGEVRQRQALPLGAAGEPII